MLPYTFRANLMLPHHIPAAQARRVLRRREETLGPCSSPPLRVAWETRSRQSASSPPRADRLHERIMSSFHGNSGQDWTVANVGRSSKPFKKPTEADKKQDLTKAMRSGQVSTASKMGGATNKSVMGHGMMGTTAGPSPARRPRPRPPSPLPPRPSRRPLPPSVARPTPRARRRRRAENRGGDGDLQGPEDRAGPRQGAHAGANSQEDVAKGPRHED